jgi:GT2 family glycosyltransferase
MHRSERAARRAGAAPMPEVESVTSDARPFWSVMIPCYNSATLLAETLASVLAQDEGAEAMQIEVVDDASTTDDPAAVVADLGGGRVGYFRQPRNVGAPANFTTCVRRARGTWVHVLHSDDLVKPGFYERYRQRIEACPDALMVASPTIQTDPEARPLGVTPAVAVAGGYVVDAALTIATTNPLRCASVVVARRAYEELGGFHPDLFHAADWEMWCRVAGAGPVAWVEVPMGLYRSHPGSDTSRLHRSTAYLEDCAAAVEIIAGRLGDVGSRTRARAGGRRVVADYGLTVASELAASGRFRPAAANTLRSVRYDHSLPALRRATTILRVATSRGARGLVAGGS